MDNWSVYKLFPLLVLVTVGVDNSGEHVLNNHSLNLGATITKLAVSDKYVYVGGVNFVAQLTKSLDVVLFNLTIGPVLKDEDCRPQTGPCDNQVMVIEIDANLGRLVVCGTAYRGTCTLHSLSDITDWRCLYGDNGADILAGDVTHTTVLQISPKSPVNDSLISLNKKNLTRSKYITVEQTLFKLNKTTIFYPTNSLSSSILYVSSLDKNTGSITTSIRQVDFINQQYVIKCVNQTVVKFTQEKTTVYMSSFFWGDNSYIISTQIQHGYNNVTVLSRVDKDMIVSNTVLECKHNSTRYCKIKSTSLLQWGQKKPPVVIVILGSSDPDEGFVMCGFSLDKINPVPPAPQMTTRDPQHYRHTENKSIRRSLFHFKFAVREFNVFIGSGNLSPAEVVMVTQESGLQRIVLTNQDLCPLHSTSWDCEDRGCKWCHRLGACMNKNKDRTSGSIRRNKRAQNAKPAEDDMLNCSLGKGVLLSEIKFVIQHHYSQEYKVYVGNDLCISTRKRPGNKTECSIRRKPFTEKTTLPVKVQVNNQTLYCKDNFTFQPDPKFERIEPKAAILSGGTYITIFGTNLEEADTKTPVINITVNGTKVQADLSKWSASKDGNNKTQWRTFKSPNMKTRNITENLILNGKSYLSITWAHVEKIEDFKIYPDPELFNQGLTIRTIGDSSLLVIQGRNIPTWLNKDEIQVYVGKVSCNVLDSTESAITCNATFIVNNIVNSCNTSSTNQTGVDGTTTAAIYPVRASERVTTSTKTENYDCSHLELNLILNEERTILNGFSADVQVEIGNFKKILPKVKIFFTHITVEDNSNTVIIISAVTIVAVVVLALVVYLRISRLQAKNNTSITALDEGVDKLWLAHILESTLEPEDRADIKRLFINPDSLIVGKTIGKGNFGCVFEGFFTTAKDSEGVKVAVKTLQESVSQSMDLKGFVQEAVMMREFQHPNVLGLVGLSEKEPGVPYVVLPFMENGDLLTYVRDPDKTLKFSDALKYGADIASGMAYLSIRDFVHRDLAARNCLLDDRLRVKIGDFGLCRSVYGSSYYTSTNKTMLPIRWMAPESIEVGCYSTKSDVWSFGVVMWELLTRGLIPYPGLQNSEVHGYLQQSRLARPYFCPIRLYEALLYCWQVDPGLRPNFQSLQEFLRLLFRSISRANDKCRDCIDTLQRGKDPQGQCPQKLTIPQTELNTPCSGICLLNKSFDAEIIIPECRCLLENIADSTNRDNLAKAENMEYIQPKDDWNYLIELLHQEMPASEEIGSSYIDVIDNYEEIGGSYINVIDNYEEITTTM